MSRSGRKRNSKWDLKEVPELPLHDDDWPRQSTLSHRDKDLHPGRHDSEFSKDRKWSAQKNDNIHEDRTMAWDGDEHCSMKMSPGLDEWRQKRCALSPNRGWSRSRRSRSRSRSRSQSQSPGRGFKCNISVSDRSRSRPGVVNRVCRDFASGRCRGGDRCQFVHNYNQNYEDKRHSEGDLIDSRDDRSTRGGASKYSALNDMKEYTMKNGRPVDYCNNFLKGKCWKGEACRYAHHDASEGSEVSREGLTDRRNRDRSSEFMFDRESRRSVSTPCKFYPAGNCRNGKNCRFSHLGHAYPTVEGRSRDDRQRLDHNLDNAEQSIGHLVWSDSDTLMDSANFPEAKNGKVDDPAIEERIWSMDDDLKAIGNKKSELTNSKTEDTGPELGVSKSMVSGKWLGEVDKPASWNCRVRSPKDVIEGEPECIPQNSQPNFSNTYIPAHEQDMTQAASGQMHHTSTSNHSMIYGKSSSQHSPNLRNDNAFSYQTSDRNAAGDGTSLCLDLNFSVDTQHCKGFNYNGKNLGTQPFSTLDVVGQGQAALIPSVMKGEHPENSQNFPQFLEEELKKSDSADANTSQVTSGILPAHNTVNNEQLAQLNNLSASLAQLLGSGQQLPQLYATLNSTSTAEPLPVPPNSVGLVAKVAATSVQANPAIGAQKLYDPLSTTEPLPLPPNYVGPVTQVAAISDQSNPAIESRKQYEPLSATESLPLPPNYVGLVTQVAATSDLTNLAIGPRKQYDPLSATEQPAPSISVGLVTPVDATSFQTNPAIGSQNQYDPLSDSIDPINPGELNGSNFPETGKLEDLNQVKSTEVSRSNGRGAMESKKAEEEAPETGLLSNMNRNGKVDANKKSKDPKGIRAFKFALAEFVKELLKPTWKDGRINKDVYKIIVKKVVDKVTGTIEGAHIPQNQEKINQYLSSSKPKLSKLVQAYVERHQKS